MKTFKMAFLQFKPVHKDVKANLAIIQSYKDRISKVDMVVLPELATTGYVFEKKEELFPIAEELPQGPQSEFFFTLAKETNTLIITGIAEKKGSFLYNSQVAFYPDGHFEKYRKIHLFFKEKNIFDIAYNEPKVIEYRGVKIGLMVCFDWAFPEHARILTLKGAHILAHSSNLVLPGLGQDGMKIRSIENRVFSITANRYGKEGDTNFTGKSQIIDPYGRKLKEAPENADSFQYVEINPFEAENKNITPLNNILQDRRTELYNLLCKKNDL